MTAVDSFKEAAPLLRRPFTPQAVRFKLQTKGGLVVAYIDQRLVVERFNLVCPHLWHDRFEPTPGGNLLCHLTVDGITRTDIGEGKGKGLFSDALKRAAVKFGVGVSLYAVPQQWAKGAQLKADRNGEPAGLTPQGEQAMRTAYAAWLDAVGIQAFGEPLDHGDADDAQGDIEVGT